MALHYYCGGAAKGKSTEFDDKAWYALLSDAGYMDELIRNHWQLMGEIDTQRRIKLIVDEWGAWHETDPSIGPSYLWAYWPTLRDALVSGITLDIFNNHADKVAMANAAQLVNNIHTSFLARGDQFTVTPVYHVFHMYSAHQGGTAVRALFDAPSLDNMPASRLAALSGSCSLHEKRVVLTVVNPHIRDAADTEIHIRGGKASNVRATVLSAADIHAHNTFDQPHAIEPSEKNMAGQATALTYQFAPASVTKLEFDLA